MPKKKHTGRKVVPIDWKEVEKFLIYGSNGVQIAAYIGITEQTLYSRCVRENKKAFSLYSLEKKQKGNSLLLGKQFQTAMSGNVAMLIWLGKQRLNQTDQPRNPEEFSGSLSNLLNVLHMIKTSQDFDKLISLTKESQKEVKEVNETTEVNDGG